MRELQKNPNRLLRGSGISVLLLGIIGVFLSTGELKFLADLWDGGLLMVFNTGFCFCLCGVGLIALSKAWSKLTVACGILIGALALGVLLEYITGRSFGIDQLFIVQTFPPAMPGRMGLNTAIALIFTAAGLFLLALKPKSFFRLIPAVAGGLFGLSIIAFLGFLAGLRPSLTQGYFTMTLSAASGFTLIATTLLLWTRHYDPHRNAVISIGAMGVTMLLSLGTISVLSSEKFDSAHGWVHHTFAVRELLHRISLENSELSNVRSLEESQRSILPQTALRMREHADELIQRVADNSFQRAHAKRLEELIEVRLTGFATDVPIRPAWRPQAVGTSLAASQVQKIVDEMLAKEEFLLQQRSERTDLASKQMQKLSVVGGLLAAALLGFAIGLLEYAERRRHRAEAELIRANKDLQEASALAHESTRLKAQFLANMSHEIRTPMNGVVGMTELLLDTRLSGEQRMLADTVRSSANTLLAVLNDILDFSKIEAGQLIFNKASFDLREPIENCLGILAKQAHAKGLELAYLLEENVPTQIEGDSNRLGQVLLNLVGNAVKFTSQGEVILRVEKIAQENSTALLRFSTTDTGVGISEEDQKKLFQPFVQVDGGGARKFGGTGLGLAICRQLVHLMEGEIGLESKAGKGSTFWFTVPFPVSKPTPKVIVSKEGLAGFRGLIVDDNATNREILLRQLGGWLIEAEAVTSGTQALKCLHEKADSGAPFHFAILDMNMPGMDGIELARAIRADSKFASSKLLLLTSMGQMLSDEELKAAGIDAFLVKPARHEQLHQKLAELISTEESEKDRRDRIAETSMQSALPADIKLRILVAEDNLVNQHVIRLQLERFGYQTALTGDGAKAIEAAMTKEFDVIFMDCQMPDVDGLEATRRIRKWEAQRQELGESFRPIHIIAMTANAMVGDREACLEAGMDDYLSKPVRPALLAEALARAPAAHL